MIDRLFDVALLTNNEQNFLSILARDGSNTAEADSDICTVESEVLGTSDELVNRITVGGLTDSWVGSLCVDFGILEPEEVEVCEYEASIQCREVNLSGTKH